MTVSHRSSRGPKRSRSHGGATWSAEDAPAGLSSWSCQGGQRCAARPSRSRGRFVGRLGPSSACLTLMISTQRVRVNKRMKAKPSQANQDVREATEATRERTVHAGSEHAAGGPSEAMLHDLLRCAARGAVVTLPLVGVALLLLARPGAGGATRNVDHRPEGRQTLSAARKGFVNAAHDGKDVAHMGRMGATLYERPRPPGMRNPASRQSRSVWQPRQRWERR